MHFVFVDSEYQQFLRYSLHLLYQKEEEEERNQSSTQLESPITDEFIIQNC
jgi:hypothetical protein